ncbi:hypothetical protein [Roseburia sp. 499]|uniref:hypothetical protein n=1 Tax=Roseburia sp. 499 TaxID=1261634 RepID=UPI000952155C|nr:hypothetical protein [Roseburia sp. 499]WVK68696.1 hypothetical protein BIV20_09875 [Roseburia sp. 499]
MGKINIDVDALDSSISELKALKSNWLNNEVNAPTVVGGGGTVSQLEEIARLYVGLNMRMCGLMSSTISFLENTRQNYVESDQAVATKMKREQ